ncbi:hypothetical protein D3C87_482530 [compost metagenome]
MFTHREDTPLVFYMSELDSTLMPDVFDWFLRRKPEHFVRTLVNRESDDYGHKYELIFANKIDAMEFKLTFL